MKKRMMSLLMCIVMLLGMLPTSVMAYKFSFQLSGDVGYGGMVRITAENITEYGKNGPETISSETVYLSSDDGNAVIDIIPDQGYKVDTTKTFVSCVMVTPCLVTNTDGSVSYKLDSPYDDNIQVHAVFISAGSAVTISTPTGGSVTVIASAAGEITSDTTKVAEGETVTLTAAPSSGYQFSSWNVYKTGDSSTKVTVDSNNQFTMPAYPVTVSAAFEANPSAGHTLQGAKMWNSGRFNDLTVSGSAFKDQKDDDYYFSIFKSSDGTAWTAWDQGAIAAGTKVKVSTYASGVVSTLEVKNSSDTLLSSSEFKGNSPYEAIFTMPDCDVTLWLCNYKKVYIPDTSSLHGDYTVKVNDVAKSSGDKVLLSDTVCLSATADEGYSFSSWTILYGSSQDITSDLLEGSKATTASTSFPMPNYNVTISAAFSEDTSSSENPSGDSPAGNTVHFNSMGGSAKDDVTADATSNTLTSAQLAAPSTAPTSSVTGSNRIFTGWYTKDGSSSGDWGDKVTTSTVFSADTTVYARWADQFIGELGSGSAVYAVLSGTTLTIWGSGTMREGLSGTHTQGTENYWAAGLDEATTVIIEDGVTSIPEYSFWNFENLTSVTIGSGVKSIDKSAFARCPVLQSITIPANVTKIDTDAFGYCDSLTSITVASGNENYYADENGVLFEMCSGMYSDYACLLCYPAGKTATSYTIPETANGKNVTAVYDSAFNGNDHLTSLTISRNLNEICMEKEDFSFCSGCSKLESFAVTSGNQKYTALDNGVLYSHDGTSLTLIRYPENRTGTEYTVGEQVRGVSYGAFEGTKNLEHVMFNAAADKALSLAPYLFSNSSVELVDLYCTDSLDVDDDETFDGYEGDVVAMIDPAALYGLYSLISNGVSVPVVVLTGDWSSDSVQSAVAAMATELQALIASGVRFYWNPLATKWTNSSLPELLTLTSLDEKPTTGSGYIGICGNWFSVPSPTTSPKMNFAVVKDGAPLAFSTVEAALTCNEIDMNVAMGVLASPSPNLMNALPAIGAGKYVESTVTELEGQTASLFRTDVSSGTAYLLSDNRDVFAEYGLNMLLSEEEDSVQSWMLVPTSNAYTVVQTTFYGMPMWALMNDPDAQPVCMLLCAMGIWVLMVNDASAMDNCYICANAVQNTKCGENLTWSYDWFTDTLTIAGTGEMYTYENSVDAPWSDIFFGTGTVVLGEGVTGIDVSALGVTVDFIVVNNPSALESVLEQSDDLSGEYDGVGILLGCDMEEKVDVSKYNLGENRYFLNMPNVTGNEDFTPYQLYFCDQTKAIEEALSGSSYYIPVGLTFYTVNPSAALPSFMLDVDGFGTVEAHVKRSNAKPLQVVATEGGTEKALPLTDDELALTLTPNSGEAIESFELTLGNSGSFSPKTILGNMVGILNSGTYVPYEQAKPVLLAMDAIPSAYASMPISEYMICTIESKAGSGNYVPLTTAGQMFDLFVNKWLKNDEEFEENISIRLTFNLGDSGFAFAQDLYEHGGRFEASFTGGNENVIDSGYCGDPKVNNGHDVTWRLESLPAPYDASDLHLIISGTGDMQDYEDNPTVPGNPNFPWAIYDGGTVGGVGYDIYAITIEDGVTSIGDYALCLTDLRSIVFSSSITDFGTKHSIWYSLNSMPVGLSGTGWTDAKINGLCEALTSSTTINYSECHNCTRDELKATIKSHTYLMPGASMAAGQEMSPTQLYFCDQTTASASNGCVKICGVWYTRNSDNAVPFMTVSVSGEGTVKASAADSTSLPANITVSKEQEKQLPVAASALTIELVPSADQAIVDMAFNVNGSTLDIDVLGSGMTNVILGKLAAYLVNECGVQTDAVQSAIEELMDDPDNLLPKLQQIDITDDLPFAIEWKNSTKGYASYTPVTNAALFYALLMVEWQGNGEKFDAETSIRLTIDPTSSFWAALPYGIAFEASFTAGSGVIASGTCGDGLTWEIEELTGADSNYYKLTVSGTGEMADYTVKYGAPWGEKYSEGIKYIVFSDGVTKIGRAAFYGGSPSIAGIILPSTLETISDCAVGSSYGDDQPVVIGLSGKNWTSDKLSYINDKFTSGDNFVYSFDPTYYLMPDATVAGGQTLTGVTPLYFCDQTTAAAATGAAAANYVYICGEWYTTNSALGELRWRYDDENCILTIYGRGDMEDYEWVDDEDTGKKKTNEPWHYYYACYHIVVEEGVTGIGEYAFYGYGLVDSIALPSTLETIGDNAFGYQYGLTEDARKVNVGLSGSGWTAGKLSMIDDAMDNSVTVRNDENQLVDEARSCSPIIPTYYLLPGATVEDGLTLTGVTQLYEAPGTGGVNICGTTYYTTPSAITGTCGTGVTWSYDRLTKTMTISGSGDMGEPNDTWANFAIEHYVIGAGITTIWGPIISDPYGIINDNTYIVSFDVADGNKNYTSIDGVLLGINKVGGTPDGTLTLLQYPAGKGDARLDDSVEEYVTSYRIPDNVTSIGSNAFASTYLTGLVIPSSVTTFGVSLFGSVQCIVSVGLSGDWSSVASLPENFPNATTRYWMPGATPKTGLFTTEPTQLYNCNQSGEHTGGNYVQLCGTWYTTVEPKAAIGNKEYASLADAVAAAVSNDTVSMLSDAEVASGEVLSVSTGKVLDLNGHDLVVNGAMLVTGSVIDSARGGKLLFKNDPDGDGKEVGASISIDGNATMGIFNGKLPVCTNNNVDGCSEYTMVTYTPAPYGFGYNSTRQQYGVSFRITMDGSDWAKFTEGIYNVKFSINLDIGGEPRTVEFSKQSIMAAAAGKTASGDQLLYFTLWFNGTDDLSKATTVTATPTITVMIGNSTLYVKELTTKSHTFPATAS